MHRIACSREQQEAPVAECLAHRLAGAAAQLAGLARFES